MGKWKSDDGEIIDIEPLQPLDQYEKDKCNRQGCGVGLDGKHQWGGNYDHGSLAFITDPKFEVMNPDIPEWARKRVEGQLRWELKLKFEDKCDGPVLTGLWYPGEVEWTDDQTVAKVLGKGTPRNIVFHKDDGDSSDVDLSDAPVILGRARDQQVSASAEQRLSSVTKTDPFFIDLHLDPEEARKVGSSVTVTIRAVKSGKNATVKLNANPARQNVVIYTSNKPVRIARNTLESDPDAPDLWYDTLPNKIENGDTIVVSYEGSVGKAETKFKVYDSWVQQAISRSQEALQALNDVYFARLLVEKSPQAREVLHKKMQMIANARQLIFDYQPGKTESFTDLTRVEIGDAYLKTLLNMDPLSLIDTFSGSFPGDGEPYIHGDYKVNWAYPYEDKYIHSVIAAARSDYQDKVRRMIGDLSVSLYQVSLENSPAAIAEQFVVVVWGIDATGQRVDKTDRIFAGIGLGSQLLLTGAQTAQRLQKYSALEKQTFSGGGAVRGGLGGTQGVAMRPADVNSPLPRWSGEPDYVPPREVAPHQSRGTPLQFGSNTCGINVADGITRDLGLTPEIEEKTSMRDAWPDFYDCGTVHSNARPGAPGIEGPVGTGGIEGGGMDSFHMRDYLNFRGAKAGIYNRALSPSVTRFEQWLGDGRKIALKINAGTVEHPAIHWVRLEGITCSEQGRPLAIFGDPWTGKSYEWPAQLLRRRITSGGVVIAKLSP